jgi:DNA-binding GntR family transcriptional regulator
LQCSSTRLRAVPPEKSEEVPKVSAVRRTYLQLRDLIVSGAMAPGSPVIDQRVAEVVGVSRTTVRTALRQLAGEGFVTSVSVGNHHSRFEVGPLTIDEMHEWYSIVGALDGIAARGAAALPQAQRQEIALRVSELARAHLEAGSGDDPHHDQVQQLDAALHGTYVQAGGGPRLLQEYAAVRPHVDRYGIFYATALILKLPSEIYHEHCAIADAIAAGDLDLAERAAVTNWRNATVRFETVMRRWGERGTWETHGKAQEKQKSRQEHQE